MRMPSKTKKIISLLVFGVFMLAVPSLVYAQDTPQTLFNIQTDRLDNGLEIALIPNNRAPIVHHMLWYKVGAADEEWGKSGLAHFFEHLMFRGTQHLADGEYSKKVAALGGQDNAFTGQDYTAYHVSIATEFLPQIMAMEADRMNGLNLTDEVIETERQVIMEERRQRTENSPFSRFSEHFNHILYPNHPYGTPVIGWMHEIEALTPDDVRDFYEKWYAPNNAILVVSGDITMNELKAMAQKHYGALKPRGFYAPRVRPQIPTNLTPDLTQRIDFFDEQIRNPSWQKTRIVPSETNNKREALALFVLEEMMAGGQSSPLYQYFVVQNEYVLSASFSYGGSMKDYGTIGFSFVMKDPRDEAMVKEKLDAFLTQFAQNDITMDALSAAQTRMEDATTHARDGLSGPANIVGRNLAIGIDVDAIESWVSDVKSVTLDDVRYVFDAYVMNNDKSHPWLEAYLAQEKVTETALQEGGNDE